MSREKAKKALNRLIADSNCMVCYNKLPHRKNCPLGEALAELDEPRCKTCGGYGWLWTNLGKADPHKAPCPDCQKPDFFKGFRVMKAGCVPIGEIWISPKEPALLELEKE